LGARVGVRSAVDRRAAGVAVRRVAARADPPPVLAGDRLASVVGAPETTSDGHGGGDGEQETDDEAAHLD
jgi:hypothetical protein